MSTKLSLIILFLLLGCGKDVKLKNNKLESLTSITETDSIKVNQQGMLVKTESSSSIQISGRDYPVSKYSSYLALNFIQSKSSGQYLVKFRGEIQKGEIVLEILEQQ
ncbi:MAG: hypothetical protein AB7I27_16225 [Bacteriovoracaceae bacterium]